MLKTVLRAAYAAIPFKRPVFELLRPLRVPRRLYRHLHFSGPFTVVMDGEPLFRMVAGHEIVENELFWSNLGGSWDAMSLRIWCALARTSSGILDIGANTGVYALAASALNRSAKVVAFEPVQRAAERLLDNVGLNGFAIEIDRRAVSSVSGTAVMFDADPAALNYAASLEPGHGGNDRSYEVETVSIDDFLRERGWPPIDLVKIDVETHEPAVIRGMQETIARFRPAIMVEVLYPEQGREIASLASGYQLFNIDEEGRRIIPTEVPGHIHGESWNNLLCTPECAQRLAALFQVSAATPAL